MKKALWTGFDEENHAIFAANLSMMYTEVEFP